eukprot:TRINITY_DN6954_c0_g1_i5.p1 TRINITY_DN6954_c0_g1~~TRINITY_DN6954_c0_g1_i5.p1  ORF type:complete len:273 (+),score=105.31 TRINITY_DN6954_c0_g1_i5:103-819(+)
MCIRDRYTTGTKFKPHDIEINELIKRYTPRPILVVIDVEHSDPNSLPNEAYTSIEEVRKDGTIVRNFLHLPSTVRAFEPEEIGVEQLLRELRDVNMTTLGSEVAQKISSLKALISKLDIIRFYLDQVAAGTAAPNQQVIFNLQEIFNLLPNLNSQELIDAFTTRNNDSSFVLYLCSMIRSIGALHDLLNNKISNREAEREREKEKEDKKAEREKDKVAGNEKEKGEKTEKGEKAEKKD